MNRLKIKVKYKSKWFYAKDIGIDKKGNIQIDYCHDVYGGIDEKYIEEIKIELRT